MAGRISRREFAAGAAGVVFGSGGNWALAAPPDDDAPWSFPLLGDLHFDHLDHHDMEWLKRTHPDDAAQVQNYSRISREFTPKLLDIVRKEAAESRSSVPFVVQLGDLIEGLCGTEQLAK